MKRIIALVLSLTMILALCACGEEETKLAVGETASSDIAQFTLENAEFAYYLSNTVDESYLVPTDDANEMFAASTGHCFVSLTFTLTNIDRGGSLSFGGSFEDPWRPNFVLEYEGKEYPVNSYSLNNKDGETFSLTHAAIIDKETAANINEIDTMNWPLDAGSTVTIRAAGVVAVDPENLTDGFELSVNVPNSKGEYETFTYAVPARA